MKLSKLVRTIIITMTKRYFKHIASGTRLSKMRIIGLKGNLLQGCKDSFQQHNMDDYKKRYSMSMFTSFILGANYFHSTDIQFSLVHYLCSF